MLPGDGIARDALRHDLAMLYQLFPAVLIILRKKHLPAVAVGLPRLQGSAPGRNPQLRALLFPLSADAAVQGVEEHRALLLRRFPLFGRIHGLLLIMYPLAVPAGEHRHELPLSVTSVDSGMGAVSRNEMMAYHLPPGLAAPGEPGMAGQPEGKIQQRDSRRSPVFHQNLLLQCFTQEITHCHLQVLAHNASFVRYAAPALSRHAVRIFHFLKRLPFFPLSLFFPSQAEISEAFRFFQIGDALAVPHHRRPKQDSVLNLCLEAAVAEIILFSCHFPLSF